MSNQATTAPHPRARILDTGVTLKCWVEMARFAGLRKVRNEMRGAGSSVALAVAVTACAPVTDPAIYVPPVHKPAALAWAAEVGIAAPIVPEGPEGPEGPGIWISDTSITGWATYAEGCEIREAWAEPGAAYAWGALTGAAADGRAPARIGTALPPDEQPPATRIDADQARAVRLGWRDLERACTAGIFSGVP